MSQNTAVKHFWGYDISPALTESLAVFPGDTPLRRKVALDLHKGDHLTLSAVESTLHLGAHADAPSHYHAEGESMERRNPEIYFGWCEVVKSARSVKPGARLGLEDLAAGFEPQASRVLFSTESFPDPNIWNDNFVSLEPALIEGLTHKGVRLIGLDTPSVDPADSKELPAHQALYRTNCAVLEGLVLGGVPEGIYFLSALPLRIEAADASPVRAVLFHKDHMGSLI